MELLEQIKVTYPTENIRVNNRFFYTLYNVSLITLVAISFFLPISTAITNILFYLTAVLILVTFKWSYIYTTIRSNKIALSLLVFWLLFTIALFYTEGSYIDAITRWKKHAKFLIAPLFFCLFRERKLSLYTIYLFIAAMLITCFLGYLKFFGIIKINQHLAGATSVFKSHIQTNFLLAYTSFLLLVLSVYHHKMKFIFILLFLLVSFNTMYLGTGRTGMVIFFCLSSFFVFRILSPKWILVSSLAIFILPILLFYSSNSFKRRITTVKHDIVKYRNNQPDTSVGLRLSYLFNGIKIIRTNPIYGSGTGSVPVQFKRIERNVILQTNNPHNEYINVGIQIGIIGLIYLMLMFIIQSYYSTKLPSPFNLASQGILVSIIVGCTANSLLMDTTEGHFYVYFITAFFANMKYNSSKLIY